MRALGESVPVYATPTDDELRAPRPPWWRRRGVLAAAGVVTLALVLGGWAVLADRAGRARPGRPGRPRPGRRRTARTTRRRWRGTPRTSCTSRTRRTSCPRSATWRCWAPARSTATSTGGSSTSPTTGPGRCSAPRTRPRALAASDQLGWVAWVDPAGANPRLLVYDVGQAAIIGELDLPASRSGPQEEPDTHPVAIDQQTVYFVTTEGARAWRPTRDPGYVGADPARRGCSTWRRPTGCSRSGRR